MSDKKSNMSLYITLSVIFIIIIATLWLFYSSRSWNEVTGEIQKIELEKVKNRTISSMSHNKSFTDYKINLLYGYTVDGVNYQGTRFYPLIPNVFSEKQYADELMDRFKVGDKTTVYYNPDSPELSCLITSGDISKKKYIILVGILFVFGIVFLVAFKYINKLLD